MPFKTSREAVEKEVGDCRSFRELSLRVGRTVNGGAYESLRKKMDEWDIDYSHFTGQSWSAGLAASNRKEASQYLVRSTRKVEGYRLRRCLIEIGRAYVCVDCGLGGEWNGFALTLEVDHIDRDNRNNEPDNLRFLCPNCHSQYGTTVGVVVERTHGLVAQRQEAPP